MLLRMNLCGRFIERYLASRSKILVRAGWHCMPLGQCTFGTTYGPLPVGDRYIHIARIRTYMYLYVHIGEEERERERKRERERSTRLTMSKCALRLAVVQCLLYICRKSDIDTVLRWQSRWHGNGVCFIFAARIFISWNDHFAGGII